MLPGRIALNRALSTPRIRVSQSLALKWKHPFCTTAVGIEDDSVRANKERHLIVVGLGNPGAKYERTVHNVGFMVCDFLARSLEEQGCALLAEAQNPTGKFLVSDVEGVFEQYQDMDRIDTLSLRQREKTLEEGVPYPRVLYSIVKPLTYMNNSGGALKGYLQRINVNPRKLKRVTSKYLHELVSTADVQKKVTVILTQV